MSVFLMLRVNNTKAPKHFKVPWIRLQSKQIELRLRLDYILLYAVQWLVIHMWPLSSLQTIIITEVVMHNLEKRLWSQYFTLLFEYVLGFSHTEESYSEGTISTPTNPHFRVASTRFYLRCCLCLSYKDFS